MRTQLTAFLAGATLATVLVGNAHAELPALPVEADVEELTAPVTVDGRTLFRVRGTSSYPAQTRATAIEDRIIVVAAEYTFDPKRVQVVDTGRSFDVVVDERRIVAVFPADAELEHVDAHTLAITYQEQVRKAIENYRRDRTSDALWAGAVRGAIATAVFLAGISLFLWLTQRLSAFLESRYAQRMPSVSIQSFQIVQAQRIWSAIRASLRVIRFATIAVLSYLYLQFVLISFVWTRPTAERLLDHLLTPLARIGRAVLDNLPNLFFLAILILVVRYGLRLLKLFFDAVSSGGVQLKSFDPEWAVPSYRLVRVIVIVFSVVIAYPYIPGSESEAFKGLSLLLGVMLSIGSSSFIANVVAGYALIYRRAFKIGDRVKIDDTVGDVVQRRLQVTHLRSLKGEEVIIPNSLILNNKVLNYSSFARQQELILHTTVGIGYEVGWRQVEAMLMLAAQRTAGLVREPKPFVMQKELGDFAVTYELNAYCGDAQAMPRLYTALHRNILDVFNEHGVQIMTPAYEGDPQQPKIVPQDEWFAAPAAPDTAGASAPPSIHPPEKLPT